jgi:O-acetyl-ADP-ribose deacetylase (regulator of RNase III)
MPTRQLEVAPHRTLTLLQGDITRIAADAIVNAANSALAGGGGVDGAIHRAGGPTLMAELDAMRSSIGRLPAGQAVATTAGKLPAQYVFHAVGPVYRDGRSGEPEALASCYRVCLRMAEERALRRISFPAISTGVYGYPFREATAIAIREVKDHLRKHAGSVEEVLLVFFSASDYEACEVLLDLP